MPRAALGLVWLWAAVARGQVDDPKADSPPPPPPAFEPAPPPIQPPPPSPPSPLREAPAHAAAEPPRPPPPPRAIARHELFVSGGAESYQLNFDLPTRTVNFGHGFEYYGTLGYAYLIKPLVDDGMPLSLQRFLQRTPSVDVSVTASSVNTTYVPGATSSSDSAYRSVNPGGSLAVTFFPVRALRIGLGASLSASSSWTDSTSQPTRQATALNANFFIGAGWRGDRWELALTYGFQPAWQQGTLAPIQWGTLQFDVRGLVASRVWLTGSVSNLPVSGVRVGGSIEGFVTPRLGLYGNLSVSNGDVFLNSTSSYTAVQLSIGAGWWITGSVQLNPVVFYRDYSGSDVVSMSGTTYHRELQYFGGTLEVRFRFR